MVEDSVQPDVGRELSPLTGSRTASTRRRNTGPLMNTPRFVHSTVEETWTMLQRHTPGVLEAPRHAGPPRELPHPDDPSDWLLSWERWTTSAPA